MIEVGRRTVEKALTAKGYPATTWNILTIQDGLQWEDREDYDSIQDAVASVIEDKEFQLRRENELPRMRS